MRRRTYIVIVLCALFLLQARAQELLNYPLDTINGEEVYRYQVERSIGLYRIGVNFGVSQNEIVRLNPQLRERGLHYAETLYIPTGRPVVAQPAIEEPRVVTIDTVIHGETIIEAVERTVQVVDSIVAQSDSVRTDSLAADSVIPDPRRIVELALMLPFESQQTKRSANAERMTEFYQGALLALRAVQDDSTLYRLRVYDSERTDVRVAELCDSTNTELDSIQGILGLVYPAQIVLMAEWCEVHQVPLILPFSDDVRLENRTQVMQFNSTDEQEADSLCAWMIRQDSTIRCVAVDVRETETANSIRILRRRMRAQGIEAQRVTLREIVMDSANYALDPEKENIIILHSDRYQQVRILLPHIARMQQAGYRVRIVSQFAWQKESIDLPQIYTSVFAGEGDRTAYEEAWKTYYVNEHVSLSPRYDLLGYDLMHALLRRLQGEAAYRGLQSDIEWQQVNEFSGWQNKEVRVIEK